MKLVFTYILLIFSLWQYQTFSWVLIAMYWYYADRGVLMDRCWQWQCWQVIYFFQDSIWRWFSSNTTSDWKRQTLTFSQIFCIGKFQNNKSLAGITSITITKVGSCLDTSLLRWVFFRQTEQVCIFNPNMWSLASLYIDLLKQISTKVEMEFCYLFYVIGFAIYRQM